VLVEADIAELPCRRAIVLLYGGEGDTDEKESKKLHFKRYVPRSQFRVFHIYQDIFIIPYMI